MTPREFMESLRRSAVMIQSEESLLARLASGETLTVKLGADPNRPDLHLGHSVVLRRLREFQDMGHRVVFVIGDFTAMIGDPSGKSRTRPPLTFEETRRNGRTYFEQVTKILDPLKTVVAYNSEWLGAMNFAQVLALAGKYTLARILERDDFAKRYAAAQPIGLHELFYPLMQGYDSVALSCDVEVGGSDQTFNLYVGRELQRDYGKTPQEIITFPLLPGLDGVEKMSKSLGNCIGLDESPEVMFEKCMRVPDSALPDYFRLTTDIGREIYEPLLSDARAAHFLYAREIVRLYHGQDAVAGASRRYHDVASGGAPEEIETFAFSAAEAGLIEILTATRLAATRRDARRLIEGGGIKIGGAAARDARLTLTPGTHIISRGKNKFARVEIAGD